MIRWKNWSNPRLTVYVALLVCTPALGQDLDYYFDLAYQGKVEEVAEALPQLYRQHPNDGSILYLEGLITQDGDTAFEMFKRVAQLYPTSPYADDALLKIGEYLYARGLYTQAAHYLKRIPVHYPRSELVYPSIRLFLNALLVSGDRDTALFYAQVFSRKYPEIEFDLETGKASGPPEDFPAVTDRSPTGGDKAGEVSSGVSRPSTLPAYQTAFQLQAGAFSVKRNAERQKALLESLNYRVRIVLSRRDDSTLHLVMVEGFKSREEAELAGKLLKEKYGIDSLVLPGQ
ncbi:MAG: SPOR domain-containing protein [Candidatus Neomarinimicrobiota bacterium]